MAEWITPIYDRTQADVDFAISKINEWKKPGSTDVYDLKGCLNVADINRIENNIKYLSDTLSTLGYFPNTVSKIWEMSGLPDITEVNRILGNIEKMISAFYQSESAPELPETMLTYEQINNIEENLYFLKEMLDDMVGFFRECGTFTCGEEW